MKKLIRVLIILTALLIVVGCVDEGQGDKYDNLIVKDTKGNYYRLVHYTDDGYYIRKIDIQQIEAFKETK